MMMKLHTKIGRAGILSLAALILLLGAAGILEIFRQNTARDLSDQWAARRWEKNGYAQISGYFPEGAGDVPGRIYSLTAAVDKALQEAEARAKQMKDEYLSVEHLFLGLLEKPSRTMAEIWKSYAISEKTFLPALQSVRGNTRVTGETPEETYDALDHSLRSLSNA